MELGLSGGSAPSVASTALRRPEIPLVGRRTELERLQGYLDRVASGTASVLVIEGEAGIGKSRLVAEVPHLAESRGFALLHGAADELSRTRPFGVVADALGITRFSSGNYSGAKSCLLLRTRAQRAQIHHWARAVV